MSTKIYLKSIGISNLEKNLNLHMVDQAEISAKEKIEVAIQTIKINQSKFSLFVEATLSYEAHAEDKIFAHVDAKYHSVFDISHKLQPYTHDSASNFLSENPIIVQSIENVINQYVSMDVHKQLVDMGVTSDLPLFVCEIE